MTLTARTTASADPALEVPTTMADSCGCNDHEVDRLRVLMDAGMSQWDASRLLWSPKVPPGVSVAVTTPGLYAVGFVRAILTARLPWLRLPEVH